MLGVVCLSPRVTLGLSTYFQERDIPKGGSFVAIAVVTNPLILSDLFIDGFQLTCNAMIMYRSRRNAIPMA